MLLIYLILKKYKKKLWKNFIDIKNLDGIEFDLIDDENQKKLNLKDDNSKKKFNYPKPKKRYYNEIKKDKDEKVVLPGAKKLKLS